MALTGYSVGDVLTSDKGSGFYLKVKKVYDDGDIDVSVNAPTGYTTYQYAGSDSASWAPMTNGGNHHISDNTTVWIRVTKTNSPETKWVEPWSWYGNYWSKTQIAYGHQPWELYKKWSGAGPRWTDSVTKLDYVKGITKSEWEYVPNTYKWATSESQYTSGWMDGGEGRPYVDPVTGGKNRYARKIRYQIRKKSAGSSETVAKIKVDKIGTPDTSRPSIDVKDRKNNSTTISHNSTYTRPSDIQPYWSEDSKFNWTISKVKFTNLSGTTQQSSMSSNKVFSEYGTYEWTITATNKETTSISESKTFKVKIEDVVPPPDFKIYDKVTPSIIYDMSNEVYLGPCYPTIDVPAGCDVEAVLNTNPYSLGSAVSENGYYEISVTIKKRTNGMTKTKDGNFTIDNIPPEAPIIDVGDGNLYQGMDYGLVEERFPNPISMRIKVESGAQVVDREVWFKKHLFAEWERLSNTSNSMTFSQRGIYRITARARKLTNGLYSEYTTVEVYKKVKFRWSISLSPNDLCYRTIATPNFSMDTFYKYQYKIDDGPWQWYRDPIKIYKNCTISVRSLDGDDDYESYVTTKLVDIIDTAPPAPPVIEGVEDGGIYLGVAIPTLAD
jgi:hypothetical protein